MRKNDCGCRPDRGPRKEKIKQAASGTENSFAPLVSLYFGLFVFGLVPG